MQDTKSLKVATYDQAVEVALRYVKESYKNISNVKVERAYMQPHWEEGNWIVELHFNTRERILSKPKHVKLTIHVNPLTGELKAEQT